MHAPNFDFTGSSTIVSTLAAFTTSVLAILAYRFALPRPVTVRAQRRPSDPTKEIERN